MRLRTIKRHLFEDLCEPRLLTLRPIKPRTVTEQEAAEERLTKKLFLDAYREFYETRE